MAKLKENTCPEHDLFLRVFLHEADLVEKERLIDHLLVCSRCRKEFSLLAHTGTLLRRESGDLPDGLTPQEEYGLRKMAGREARSARGHIMTAFWKWRAAIAAAMLFAFLAGGYFLWIRMGSPPVERGERTAVRLLEPVGLVKASPSRFRWAAVPRAESYELEIFDESLHAVLSRRIRETSAELSPEEMNLIGTGRTYIWTVESFDAEERPLALGRESFSVE
jgi:hypothetical protein